MSAKERARLEIFGRVSAGEITLPKANELLQLSYRQTKRSWSRFSAEGAVGLVHKLRGEKSNRQPDAQLKSLVLQLCAVKYADYGPTLASEASSESASSSPPAEQIPAGEEPPTKFGRSM